MRSARPPLVLLTLALTSLPGLSSAQEPCIEVPRIRDRCPVWSGTYGSGPAVNNFPTDVVVSPDGKTVYTWGVTSTTASGFDGTVVARAGDSGDQVWVATVQEPGTASDLPDGLAVSPDAGRVYVAGTTCESATATETCDLTVSALDATSGAAGWRARIDGPIGTYDSGTGVAVSPDGAVVYVSGVLSRATTGADASILALDAATGDVIWTSSYDGNRGFDSALEVALSDDGERVFLAGPSPSAATGRDFVTVSFDAETGDRVWAARYDDHGVNDLVTGMTFAAGRVVVIGTTADGTDALTSTYATVAYESDSGDLLWKATYDGGSNDMPLDVSAAPGGDAVYVTGMSRSNTAGGYDMATVAYDLEDGTQLWASRFNGLANNGDAAWAVEADPDGERVYIAGDTLVPNIDYLHAVIAYDTDDGTVQWTGLHRGGGTSNGSLRQGLDITPDGSRVYYAGIVLSETSDADFLTLAYDAS